MGQIIEGTIKNIISQCGFTIEMNNYLSLTSRSLPSSRGQNIFIHSTRVSPQCHQPLGKQLGLKSEQYTHEPYPHNLDFNLRGVDSQ